MMDHASPLPDALDAARPNEHHCAWFSDERLARYLRVVACNAQQRGDDRIAISPEMAAEITRRGAVVMLDEPFGDRCFTLAVDRAFDAAEHLDARR